MGVHAWQKQESALSAAIGPPASVFTALTGNISQRFWQESFSALPGDTRRLNLGLHTGHCMKSRWTTAELWLLWAVHPLLMSQLLFFFFPSQGHLDSNLHQQCHKHICRLCHLFSHWLHGKRAKSRHWRCCRSRYNSFFFTWLMDYAVLDSGVCVQMNIHCTLTCNDTLLRIHITAIWNCIAKCCHLLAPKDSTGGIRCVYTCMLLINYFIYNK